MPSLWTEEVVYDESESQYWTTQAWSNNAQLVALPAASVRGSQCALIFTRTVEAGLTEDVAMFRVHFSIDAGPGAPMGALNGGQAGEVEANFLAAWSGSLQALLSQRWTFKEFQWRNVGADMPRGDGPNGQPGTGPHLPSPMWRRTNVSNLGSSAVTALPDQLAATVTYRTASRKHWGRNYWGGLTTAATTGETQGKLAGTYVDALATGFRTWFNACAQEPAITNAFVWSAQHGGALAINEISVDDVADVIRRRRAKYPSYRATHSS